MLVFFSIGARDIKVKLVAKWYYVRPGTIWLETLDMAHVSEYLCGGDGKYEYKSTLLSDSLFKSRTDFGMRELDADLPGSI